MKKPKYKIGDVVLYGISRYDIVYQAKIESAWIRYNNVWVYEVLEDSLNILVSKEIIKIEENDIIMKLD